jgi:hypothetical protein
MHARPSRLYCRKDFASKNGVKICLIHHRATLEIVASLAHTRAGVPSHKAMLKARSAPVADGILRDNTSPIPRVTLRQAEAAKSLGISERALCALTRKEGVPHIAIGRMRLYPVEQLRQWAADRSVRADVAEADSQDGDDPASDLWFSVA